MDEDDDEQRRSDDEREHLRQQQQSHRPHCPQHSPLSRHESSPSAASSSKDDEVFVVDGCVVNSDPHLPRHGFLARGLKGRRDFKGAATIRQHYYPEGGWGWVVTACVFVVHVLTTGMQLSYGILYVEVVRHFGSEYMVVAAWLGVMCFAVSLFLAPFVVALCRRKSTRLTAVFGGLVMALACLFTSFAQQVHQVFLSYGVVLGIGIGLTRETSNLMLGQYFKRRREFIEIIIQSGSGIGIALFSVFLKECVHSIGWRLGLQAVTGALFLCFILGIFYRSASLYHPQRRAILHLKSQKRKIKDKSKMEEKPPYFDFSTLRTNTLQIIMLGTGMAALGLYTPLFCLMLQGTQEGLEPSSLILLQTFIGFAFAVGCVGFGLVVVRQSDQCTIARQYLCQAALFGLGVSILALTAVQGYHGYVLFVWIYGIFLGGYHYSLKMFTYERVRARFFARAWGFVQWAQSLPVLFGVPISVYINTDQGHKIGYYFSCTFTLAGAGTLFLLNLYKRSVRKRGTQTVSFASSMDSSSVVTPQHVTPTECDLCDDNGTSSASPVSGDSPNHHQHHHHHHHHLHHHHLAQGHPTLSRLGKSISFATSVDVIDDKQPDCLTCIAEEGMQENTLLDEYYPGECITSCDKVENYLMYSEYENNLMEANSIEDAKRRSSTPPPAPCTSPMDEELATPPIMQNVPRPPKSITVIEEMTTSV